VIVTSIVGAVLPPALLWMQHRGNLSTRGLWWKLPVGFFVVGLAATLETLAEVHR
jgi:hypothetical protein